MKQDKVIEEAKRLVKITITKQKEATLGKEKMFNFIKKNINNKISNEDYDTILYYYNKYLAVEGYEIVNDIDHFSIINYNTDEYYIYRKEL